MKGDAEHACRGPRPAPAQAGRGKPAAKTAAATGLTGKLIFQERSGGKIYVYDLASGSQRVLTTGADPALSPDGGTVAFWRENGGEHDLYLIDSSRRRRAAHFHAAANRCARPIGVPTAARSSSAMSTANAAVATSAITSACPIHSRTTACSRSGRWISGAWRVWIATAGAIRIWQRWPNALYARLGPSAASSTADRASRSPRTSSDESQNRTVLGEYRYQDPAAQPGGDRIVFHSLEKDHWEIYTANTDGSNVTALTRPATTLYTPLPHNVAPAWSPDGQHIVFLSNRTGQWKFWVMNPDGSGQRQLPIDVPIEYNYQAEQVVSWGK